MSNFDIKEYLENTGIEYSSGGKNVSTGWIGITCPFCGDVSNHCGINLSNNIFSCWICGESGDEVKLIAEIEQITEYEVKKKIIPLYIDPFKTPPKKKRKRIAFDVKLPEYTIKVDIDNLPKAIIAWLKRRKFSKDILKKYNAYYCLPYSKHPMCLLFPIYEHKVVVSYILVNVVKKQYTLCPDSNSLISRNSILYGIDKAKKYTKIYIVEGLTDKWRIGDKAIAILGKRLYNNQAKKIAKFAVDNKIEEIVIFLDKDAKREAVRSLKRNAGAVLLQYLPQQIEVSAILLENQDLEDDPDQVDPKLLTKL